MTHPPLTPHSMLGPWLKGFPHHAAPMLLHEVAQQGWHVLDGRLPLPLAVIKRSALEHNLQWMQAFAAARGVDMAPHGKTTMSPQLFARQIAAGAWGITFATVFQLRIGVAAGVRRALIANQLLADADLLGLATTLSDTPGLRVAFLVDSIQQLQRIASWHARQSGTPAFEVLLELGLPQGRTGVRDDQSALALARTLHASPAVRLVGIECYEGLGIRGQSPEDTAHVDALMQRMHALAQACDEQDLFEGDEVLISAGGSAVFDLVAARLKPTLRRPVRGLLRSGCYITHDDGNYQRLVRQVNARCGCADETGLRAALQVWTGVQSTPEPGLAILSAGRRDVSFDIDMPRPLAHAAAGALTAQPTPPSWRIRQLNDQHAYLEYDVADSHPAPRVGDRVALGISHPCTTFDKWHWMPIVDDEHRVVDAITLQF